MCSQFLTIRHIFLGLLVGSMIAVHAQAQGDEAESFRERLRQAVEIQSKKNQSDEQLQQRLVAGQTAKRQAMQQQQDAELRQSELVFSRRMQMRSQEEAARGQKLETMVQGNMAQLSRFMSPHSNTKFAWIPVFLVKRTIRAWIENVTTSRRLLLFNHKRREDAAAGGSGHPGKF